MYLTSNSVADAYLGISFTLHSKNQGKPVHRSESLGDTIKLHASRPLKRWLSLVLILNNCF